MRWSIRSFWRRAGLLGRDRPLSWAPIEPKRIAGRLGGTWFVCRVAYGRHRRGSTEGDRHATRARPPLNRARSGPRPDRHRPSPPRCGRRRGRSRCGRATRTPVGVAAAGPRHVRVTVRCGPADVPPLRRSAETTTPSSSTSAVAAASRRSARTRSTVDRSMPLSPSSCRIARSPRGRDLSRDSIHARAKASSSRRPSSRRRVIASSTRDGR